MLSIRLEKPEDVELIYELNKSAFGQANEAKLVDALRDGGALSYSLVAFDNDELVGYLAFSPVTIHQEQYGIVVVLGHPEFDRKLGFMQADIYGIKWEIEVPAEAFMVRELRSGALKSIKGTLDIIPNLTSYRPNNLKVLM